MYREPDLPWQTFIIVVVVFVTLFFWCRSAERCRARGGALVESGFWYECVARAPEGGP